VLEPVFIKPTFLIFIRLVAGWILCFARRTITGIYPFADPKRENVFTFTTTSSAPPGCKANCLSVEHYILSIALPIAKKLCPLPSTPPPIKRPDASLSPMECMRP
jgi:hypothetical protein